MNSNSIKLVNIALMVLPIIVMAKSLNQIEQITIDANHAKQEQSETNMKLSSSGNEGSSDTTNTNGQQSGIIHHIQNDYGPKKDNKHNVFSSRMFALALIGVASLYVLIMVCQAYRNNDKKKKLKQNQQEIESEYEYQSVSYDFSKYQSQESEGDRSAARGFRYNESIGNSREEKSFSGSNMEPNGGNLSNSQKSNNDQDNQPAPFQPYPLQTGHNKVIAAHRTTFTPLPIQNLSKNALPRLVNNRLNGSLIEQQQQRSSSFAQPSDNQQSIPQINLNESYNPVLIQMKDIDQTVRQGNMKNVQSMNQLTQFIQSEQLEVETLPDITSNKDLEQMVAGLDEKNISMPLLKN